MRSSEGAPALEIFSESDGMTWKLPRPSSLSI